MWKFQKMGCIPPNMINLKSNLKLHKNEAYNNSEAYNKYGVACLTIEIKPTINKISQNNRRIHRILVPKIYRSQPQDVRS